MTDKEKATLCAQAMGFRVIETGGAADAGVLVHGRSGGSRPYSPLKNDGEAMALMKRFRISAAYEPDAPRWQAYIAPRADTTVASADLNRAIVECAVKLLSLAAGGRE